MHWLLLYLIDRTMCILPWKNTQSDPTNYNNRNDPYLLFGDPVINDYSRPDYQVCNGSNQARPEQQQIYFPLYFHSLQYYYDYLSDNFLQYMSLPKTLLNPKYPPYLWLLIDCNYIVVLSAAQLYYMFMSFHTAGSSFLSNRPMHPELPHRSRRIHCPWPDYALYRSFLLVEMLLKFSRELQLGGRGLVGVRVFSEDCQFLLSESLDIHGLSPLVSRVPRWTGYLKQKCPNPGAQKVHLSKEGGTGIGNVHSVGSTYFHLSKS